MILVYIIKAQAHNVLIIQSSENRTLRFYIHQPANPLYRTICYVKTFFFFLLLYLLIPLRFEWVYCVGSPRLMSLSF